MRRLLLLALLGFVTPSAAEAQPRLLVGGGFSAPSGSIADAADPGFHLQASLQVAIPTLPLSLRGDGTFHRFGASGAGAADPEILAGAGSLVYHLPGVSLQPYILAGIGSYRTEAGPVDETEVVTDTGYHGGFGVAIGGLGFGAFAEVRYVQIQADQTARVIPLTVGFRF
ncbi:MAG: hypothetical protein AMS19_01055 [Gemmatimonas sp. SG8_23]|jgi:hypothetical protein|nr:MAG: hypothetical protein AMS19_01055 [Gemmatimonas sp. SG8_23]